MGQLERGAAAPADGYWDRRSRSWERNLPEIDTHLDEYGRMAMASLALKPGEVVVDLGCGPGTTTAVLAGQVGPTGAVLAVDTSQAMLELAQRRCAGLPNVSFAAIDIETGDIGVGFTAGFSRFALTMVSNPAAAFRNVRRAVRPGGRLAFTTWGPLETNPWMYEPVLAVAALLGLDYRRPLPEPRGDELSDPDVIRSTLRAAGWEPTVIEALTGARQVSSHAQLAGLLEEGGPVADRWDTVTDSDVRSRCLSAVTDAIERYRTSDGWALPSTAFAVLAVERQPEDRRL